MAVTASLPLQIKKTAGEPKLPGGPGFPIVSLERVTQRKFHHAWLGERPAIVADGTGCCERAVESDRRRVESHGIRQVEGVRAEPDRVPLGDVECLV